jgi:hypothetical protein
MLEFLAALILAASFAAATGDPEPPGGRGDPEPPGLHAAPGDTIIVISGG